MDIPKYRTKGEKMIIKVEQAVTLIKKEAELRNIVLFGSGSGAQKVKSFCDQIGIKIAYAIDNNSDNHYFNKILQLEIRSPEIIIKESKKIYILVASTYYSEISKQLSSYGLKETVDFIDFIHFSNITPSSSYGFFGNYNSYAEALEQCTGYENPIIIEKIEHYTNQNIRSNNDLLDTRSQQLLASFSYIQAQSSQKKYRVLDFGGALGAHYYTFKKLLPPTLEFEWIVFETPAMSTKGNKDFSNSELSFVTKSDFEEGNITGSFDFIISSSFIQHTDDPLAYFNIIRSFNSPFLLLNRLPFINESEDILSIQYVEPSIYEASYPAWFLAEHKWYTYIQEQHDILLRWTVPEDEVYLDNKHKVIGQGMLVQLKDDQAGGKV